MSTKRKIMCAYGSCQEEVGPDDYRLVATMGKPSIMSERYVYCCLEHAWRSVRAHDERLNGKRDDLSAVERAALVNDFRASLDRSRATEG